MSARAKSPSVLRVVVIAGAFAVLASAVTPAYAAPPHAKHEPAKKPRIVQPVGQPSSGSGGSSGPFSIEWMITAPMRS